LWRRVSCTRRLLEAGQKFARSSPARAPLLVRRICPPLPPPGQGVEKSIRVWRARCAMRKRTDPDRQARQAHTCSHPSGRRPPHPVSLPTAGWPAVSLPGRKPQKKLWRYRPVSSHSVSVQRLSPARCCVRAPCIAAFSPTDVHWAARRLSRKPSRKHCVLHTSTRVPEIGAAVAFETGWLRMAQPAHPSAPPRLQFFPPPSFLVSSAIPPDSAGTGNHEPVTSAAWGDGQSRNAPPLPVFINPFLGNMGWRAAGALSGEVLCLGLAMLNAARSSARDIKQIEGATTTQGAAISLTASSAIADLEEADRRTEDPAGAENSAFKQAQIFRRHHQRARAAMLADGVWRGCHRRQAGRDRRRWKGGGNSLPVFQQNALKIY